jgi:hypothetical protein
VSNLGLPRSRNCRIPTSSRAVPPGPLATLTR